MQTFLPLKDYEESANCLDWQYGYNRLNNQINETGVILKTLLGYYKRGWDSHPAVRMWKGCELSLWEYGQACIQAWKWRKGLEEDSREPMFERLLINVMNNTSSYHRGKDGISGNYETNHPWWLGDEKFHSCHRAILMGKDLEKGLHWYEQFGWTEEPAVRNEKGKWPYWWPVPKEE